LLITVICSRHHKYFYLLLLFHGITHALEDRKQSFGQGHSTKMAEAGFVFVSDAHSKPPCNIASQTPNTGGS
jgi:hypothetical protein